MKVVPYMSGTGQCFPCRGKVHRKHVRSYSTEQVRCGVLQNISDTLLQSKHISWL